MRAGQQNQPQARNNIKDTLRFDLNLYFLSMLVESRSAALADSLSLHESQ